ncbi:hypothetical protein N2152v2_004820 [Parachlorella kessleri]
MASNRYPKVDYGATGPPTERDVPLEPTQVPLGLVLFRNLWTSTKGTLTLDVARPTIPRKVAGRRSLFTYRKQQEEAARSRPPTMPGGQQFATRPAPRAAADEPLLPVVPFSDTGKSSIPSVLVVPLMQGRDGARLKVMRHVQLGQLFTGVTGTGASKVYPAVDIGAGLNFELDTAELKPQARIKVLDFLSLRALPRPSIKLSKRLVVSEARGWAVRLSYECPVDNVERFWEPPSRLLVSVGHDALADVDNLGNTGVRLTQSGVEFNGSMVFSDGRLTIRGAGHVDFPHQLPVEEGEPLVRYELRRLGLKANW